MKGLWIVCMLVVSAVAVACVGSETGAGTSNASDGGGTSSSGSSSGSSSSSSTGITSNSSSSSSSSGGSTSGSTSQACSTSSECPATAPCCAIVEDAGACEPFNNQSCRCTTATECSNGCCSPLADSLGNPIGPFVCQPSYNGPYDCPPGSSSTSCPDTCDDGYCSVVLTEQGSCICEEPCSDSTQCGAVGQCLTFSVGMCSGQPGGCITAAP
jgi:hypothetical protein